jgi:hypothetical protein
MKSLLVGAVLAVAFVLPAAASADVQVSISFGPIVAEVSSPRHAPRWERVEPRWEPVVYERRGPWNRRHFHRPQRTVVYKRIKVVPVRRVVYARRG